MKLKIERKHGVTKVWSDQNSESLSIYSNIYLLKILLSEKGIEAVVKNDHWLFVGYNSYYLKRKEFDSMSHEALFKELDEVISKAKNIIEHLHHDDFSYIQEIVLV
jgi:hypothetical protein